MDRYVPPRIAFFASSFEGDIEALAGEVACLRRAFPGSIAWGVSPRRPLRFSWRRGFGFAPRWQLLFRTATWCFEGCFHINHVFGGLNDWFHLKAIRRRPTVLTVAVDGDPCDRMLLDRVDRFVVEWPGGVEELEQVGIERKRVRTILPPVDLARFTPQPAPDGPFTVLFASSPEKASWLEGRGVPLILAAAALRPAIRFRLVWRPWGDSLPELQRAVAKQGLRNVEIVVGRFADMAEHYASTHATLLPFRTRMHCKPAPNSLVESLACGRPVVVTRQVGLASLVDEAHAGAICETDGDALACSLDRLESEWEDYASRARQLAERRFGLTNFVEGYRNVYRELT